MTLHTFWLIYPVFAAFHTDAICTAWQARTVWPEAGTGHLGHKLKRSRSQNFTAVFSFTLSPGSLWRLSLSGAKWWQGGGRQQFPNHSMAALWSVWNLGHSRQWHPSLSWWLSAPTEIVWRRVSGWLQLQLHSIRGSGGPWRVAVDWMLFSEISVHFPWLGWGGTVSENDFTGFLLPSFSKEQWILFFCIEILFLILKTAAFPHFGDWAVCLL